MMNPRRPNATRSAGFATRSGLLVVLVLAASLVVSVPSANAATSPTLGASAGFSALGGAAVTCTGPTFTSGAVGVSPGSSIGGFPIPCTAGGGTFIPPASDAAQADNLAAFGTLNQVPCDPSYMFGGGNIDLGGANLVPGIYCADSFSLTGVLTLSGSSGVWIFKTATTLITSSGSSVIGGDPCNVWWRIGSAATLGSTTSFIGNILAQNGLTALNTGATLNGRVLVQAAGTLTLDSNTITGPICSSSEGGGGGSGGSGGSGSGSGGTVARFTG